MVDYPITNSVLQKLFRDNFTAQGGSGAQRDLHVSDVIIPVVDLSTTSAETTISETLQQALDHSCSIYNLTNQGSTTTTIISNPGFHIIKWYYTHSTFWDGAMNTGATISITDGSTVKNVWRASFVNNESNFDQQWNHGSFIVYLRSGDTAIANSTNLRAYLNITTRQIADVSGNIVNPNGFTAS